MLSRVCDCRVPPDYRMPCHRDQVRNRREHKTPTPLLCGRFEGARLAHQQGPLSPCLVACMTSAKQPFASTEAYAKAERGDSAVASAGGPNNGHHKRPPIAQRLVPRQSAESALTWRQQRNHPASGFERFIQLFSNARTENQANEVAPRLPGDPLSYPCCCP